MSKYKIVALCGKSGSGKSSILSAIEENEYVKKIVSCTTRPPREGEINGKNYHFLTKEEFAEKVINCSMLEATSFNDWFYGTSVDSLSEDKINIGVFNPEGLLILSEDPKVDLYIFYIDCEDKIRMLRQLNRDKNVNVKEVCRRYFEDEKDFTQGFLEIVDEFKDNTKEKDLYEIIEYMANFLEEKRKE